MADDNQAALAEPGDLTREERLRILVAERDLREERYWNLLGLRGDPSPTDVKKAYLLATKTFHPDRYFGKKLGSFKERLDKLFRGVRHVYEELADPDKLAKYKASHPPPGDRDLASARATAKASVAKASEAAPDPRAEQERQERLEARRQEILAERRKKQVQPLEDREKKAHDLFAEGLEFLKKRDVVSAARALSMATAFAPNNLEYKARYEEVAQAANAGRAKSLSEEAEAEAATGQLTQAARLAAQASDLQPEHAQYAIRAAELCVKAIDREGASTYAERAVKAAPRRKEARLVAAEACRLRGDKRGAIAHLEVASSLDKGDSHVKKALKELTGGA